jgi:endo-1,4-beta-mannosidase
MTNGALTKILNNIGTDCEEYRTNPSRVSFSVIKDYGPVVLVESEGGTPQGFVFRNGKWVELGDE